MKNLKNIFLILAILLASCQSRTTGKMLPNACQNKEQFVINHKAVYEANKVTVQLYGSEVYKQIHMSVAVFYNNKQVGALKIVPLSCHQTQKAVINTGKLPDGILQVFYQGSPVIPTKILDINIKAKIDDTKYLDQSMDAPFTDAIMIGSKNSFDVKPTLKTQMDFQRYTSVAAGDGYISVGSELKPKHVLVLSAKDIGVLIPFRLYYANTFPGPRKLYTVTCLLDDYQYPAFNGLLTWSGYMQDKQGVTISGTFSIKTPGWHQIRCAHLPASVTEADSISRLIRSMYVYVPEK